MNRIKVVRLAFHAAISQLRASKQVTTDFLLATDAKLRAQKELYPGLASIQFDPTMDEPPNGDPWEEVEIELDERGVRLVHFNTLELMRQRLDVISRSACDCLAEAGKNVDTIINLLCNWMMAREPVHVIGAGRALLAASMPANRLAHGGAIVSVLGDKSPPPNSKFGGGILAASASGRTASVIKIMTHAQHMNKGLKLTGAEIKVVGIADPDAKPLAGFAPFRELCSDGCFIPVRITGDRPYVSALGDIEECIIAQILDGLIALAGLKIGANFRAGHEDLVGDATGPWHQGYH